MADHDTPGRDELRVPFLFVPDGEEPSPEWLAEHPGWVKFPGRFVPHGTSSGPAQRQPSAAFGNSARSVSRGATAGDFHRDRSAFPDLYGYEEKEVASASRQTAPADGRLWTE